MRRLALLALALLLPGCAQPDVGGYGPLRGCHVDSAGAWWTEPGIAETLHARPVDGVTLARVDEGSALPFHDEALSAEWGDIQLMSIHHQTPGEGRAWTNALRPGEIAIVVELGSDDPRLGPRFRQFLGELGLADHPETPAWERQFTKWKAINQWPPRAWILAEPDVQGLYERLRDNLTLRDQGAGGFSLTDGNWTLYFQLAAWHVTGLDHMMVVSAEDRVVVNVPRAQDESAEDAVRTRVAASFQRLGLPPPTFQDLEVSRGPC